MEFEESKVFIQQVIVSILNYTTLPYRVHHKSGVSSISVVLMMFTTMLSLLTSSNEFRCIKIFALLIATLESVNTGN